MSDLYPCPCCANLTRDEPAFGTFEICPVCFWDDDEVQGGEPEYAGAANTVCLRMTQDNLKQIGAMSAECLE